VKATTLQLIAFSLSSFFFILVIFLDFFFGLESPMRSLLVAMSVCALLVYFMSVAYESGWREGRKSKDKLEAEGGAK